MRRVLLAVTELRAGGAERVLSLLAAGLNARGVEPLVVCLENEGSLAPALKDEGVAVRALGSGRGWDLAALRALRRLVRKAEPDVLHAHDRWALLYLAFATRLMRRPPLVFSAHGLLYGERARARWRYRLAARDLAAATAVSDEVADRHRAYFGWNLDAHIVPNGVPEPVPSEGARRRLRSTLGVPADTTVFLAVGNARPEKGFEDLLDAAAHLREASAGRFVVLVCGRLPDSKYVRGLRRLQETRNLAAQVRFLGYRRDAWDLYAAADAFVLSSRSEGLPMVVLEAMMAGLPVVATRVGGVPDAVGDCGLLVPPERPGDLADAMGRLLADPAWASGLGEKAAARARREFSLDRMVSRYMDVYTRVATLAQPPKPR